MCTEAAGKPGSVVDDHFSQYRRCHRSSGAHLRLKAVRAAPCRGLGLLRVGFAMPLTLRRERWALTPPFHPYRCWLPNTGGALSVVLSLSPRDWRRLDLPVTLPCGARTFLGHPKVDAVVWRRERSLWAKSGGATCRLRALPFKATDEWNLLEINALAKLSPRCRTWRWEFLIQRHATVPIQRNRRVCPTRLS